MERIIGLEQAATEVDDPDLIAAVDGIKQRLRDIAEATASTGPVSPGAEKALFTALPWALICLLMVVAGGSGTAAGFVGMLIVAVPLIILNVNLPDFERAWINHWLIPWGEMVVVMVYILRRQAAKADRAA